VFVKPWDSRLDNKFYLKIALIFPIHVSDRALFLYMYSMLPNIKYLRTVFLRVKLTLQMCTCIKHEYYFITRDVLF